MREIRRKFGRLWWVTVTVAVLLALVFAVQAPLVAFAESTDGGKGKYIKEMILISASSKTDAESKVAKLNSDEKAAAKAVEDANALVKDEKDKQPVPTPKVYYLFGTPIYSHEDADGNPVQTYIAYTTTNNVKNSVKAIKPMDMKGGWSYKEYEDYLKELEGEADFLAKDLYKAICEYATHLKAEKTNALYAKKIFSLLVEDDSKKKHGLNNLSEFFVYLAEQGDYNPENYAKVQPEMITFMMQANKDILVSIECALMIACKDSYVGYDANKGEDATDTSFLTGMQDVEFLGSISGYKKNKELPAMFDVYVRDLLFSLPDLQKDIRYYIDHPVKLSEDAEAMAAELTAAAWAEEPEGTDQLSEIEQALLNEILAEGSEEEKKIAKEISNFNAYFNNLSLEEQNSYNNGKMFHDALTSCAYTGYDGDNYKSLEDLFMKYEGTTEEISEKYDNTDFYPFLAKLSEGQRALLKVGLPQFLSTYIIPVELMNTVLDNMIAELNKSAETEADKIKKDDIVSVYKDVDRSLYVKDSGIAMTSEAIVAAQSEPLEHIVPDDVKKAQLICTCLAAAAGGVAAASMITIAGLSRTLQLQANNAITTAIKAPGLEKAILTYDFQTGQQVRQVFDTFKLFGQEIQVTSVAGTEGANAGVNLGGGLKFANGVEVAGKPGYIQARMTFTRSVSAFFRMGAALNIALTWVMAVSLAVMIISIIINYVYPAVAPEDDAPYIDIPRVMCSYEEIFGKPKLANGDTEKDYIYYYGMKNPLLTDADNKRANTQKGGDGKDTTNILQHKIGDIANWTLKGMSRKWVALYYTTDSKAGKPILADTLTIVSDSKKFTDDPQLIPVRQFHRNEIFNFNQSYAVTKNKNLDKVYLGYKCDDNAGTTQTASVFSDISLWGGVIAGLILGGGIGTLVTYGIIRKRKKKMA